MFGCSSAPKLHLCIEVLRDGRFGLRNLLKVHEILESIHDFRIPGQERIRGGICTSSIDTQAAVIDVPFWEGEGER